MRLDAFSKKVAEIVPPIHMAMLKKQPDFIAKTRLTFQQLNLMEALRFLGPAKMSDLARLLAVTKSAVTGLADRLIKGKYARRAHEEGDRRIVRLELTPRGREFAERMARYRLDMIRGLFSNISERDRSSYLDILLKIKANIDRESGNK